MRSKHYVSVDYSEINPPSCLSSGAFVKHSPIGREWGSCEVHDYVLPGISIRYFDADIRKNLHIIHHSSEECTSVKSFFSLEGSIRSTLKGLDSPLSITKGSQNYIYKPEILDDHYIEKQDGPLRLVKISVDRIFYMDLLDDHECWSAELKSRLHKKQLIVGARQEMAITSKMNAILLDILHCPLAGPLQKLVIEAKVLELIAYQLDYFHKQKNESCFRVSASEKEAFHALKVYLKENYNQEHSLQSLSRAFCLNEFKLKKGFKELYGETVFGYIHEMRMKHARTLLLDERMTINNVAGRVGYKNPNHFSAAFKKQFGMAPSSLR